MYWHTKDIPTIMKQNIEQTKKYNPNFNYYLYDEKDAYNFIKENFDQEIIDAYNGMSPPAYRSDLFRYAVLYIYGGIYMDVKFKLIDNYDMNQLTYSEHYISDVEFDGYPGIINGFIVIKKNNPLMLDIINEIVINVKNKEYNKGRLGVTGPKLFYDMYNKKKEEYNLVDIDMKHYGYEDKENRNIIEYNGKIIFKAYPEYREEQSKTQKGEHHLVMFDKHCIYNECI